MEGKVWDANRWVLPKNRPLTLLLPRLPFPAYDLFSNDSVCLCLSAHPMFYCCLCQFSNGILPRCCTSLQRRELVNNSGSGWTHPLCMRALLHLYLPEVRWDHSWRKQAAWLDHHIHYALQHFEESFRCTLLRVHQHEKEDEVHVLCRGWANWLPTHKWWKLRHHRFNTYRRDRRRSKERGIRETRI